ncbi:MAG: A/G-specific adenine glycosylase [Acidobacteria bacterium]|nr:A/G-specific adenine glycosylase [Acidobacteriota bacterium]
MEELVRWFRANRRDLPWRGDPSPYAVWVSEIMLQQTQVATVIPYFHRFMERFPTVGDLAAASETEVLKVWEGLGYYARARNLHQAARDVVRDQGGALPADYDVLRQLKGLGGYTAAAVASIAFGVPVPSVDGNVLRVTGRLFAIRENVRTAAVHKAIFARLDRMIRSGNADLRSGGFAFQPGEFNESLMELGAMVCVPRQPRCPACPLESFCEARKAGLEVELPLKTPKPAVPLRHAVCLLATDGDRVLVRRRASRGLFGGLWEFPWAEVADTEDGGPTAFRKKENSNQVEGDGSRVPGLETEAFVLVRLMESAGCGGTPRPLGTVEQAYSHFRLRMRCYVLNVGTAEHLSCLSRIGKGCEREEPRLEGRGEFLSWVPFAEARSLPFHGIARKALAFIG